MPRDDGERGDRQGDEQRALDQPRLDALERVERRQRCAL
jgi:hypothetical protein